VPILPRADRRLAVANIAGVLIFLPARIAGWTGPAQPVPFGPLLALGFLVAGLLPAHLTSAGWG